MRVDLSSFFNILLISEPVYSERLRDLVLPLKLLCEHEIFRLCVWNNPLSEPKKGSDALATTERTMLDVSLS